MSEHGQYDEAPPRKKLVSYDELYPGRFLKAGELLGKKFTLTITDIYHEELQDQTGTKKKVIISFRETEKKLVACKTNGLCIKAMFGKTLADWIGKRVTLFPGDFKGEEALRVWGSPDIAADMPVEIALARKRPVTMTMHKVAEPKRGNGGGNGNASAPAREPGGEG